MAFLVESRNVLHSGQLKEEKPNTEDITFVDVVFGKPGVTVNNMSLP